MDLKYGARAPYKHWNKCFRKKLGEILYKLKEKS